MGFVLRHRKMNKIGPKGKVTQEKMTDADAEKVTAKKRGKNRQMQTKTRLTKKESR